MVWIYLSKTNILVEELRAFSWMTGVVSSNITCALIITQMSLTTARWLHWLLAPVFLVCVAVIAIPGVAVWEVHLLYLLAVFVTLAHVHYGISVVLQMSNFLHIYPFSIDKPPSMSLLKSKTTIGRSLERIDSSKELKTEKVGDS